MHNWVWTDWTMLCTALNQIQNTIGGCLTKQRCIIQQWVGVSWNLLTSKTFETRLSSQSGPLVTAYLFFINSLSKLRCDILELYLCPFWESFKVWANYLGPHSRTVLFVFLGPVMVKAQSSTLCWGTVCCPAGLATPLTASWVWRALMMTKPTSRRRALMKRRASRYIFAWKVWLALFVFYEHRSPIHIFTHFDTWELLWAACSQLLTTALYFCLSKWGQGFTQTHTHTRIWPCSLIRPSICCLWSPNYTDNACWESDVALPDITLLIWLVLDKVLSVWQEYGLLLLYLNGSHSWGYKMIRFFPHTDNRANLISLCENEMQK